MAESVKFKARKNFEPTHFKQFLIMLLFFLSNVSEIGKLTLGSKSGYVKKKKVRKGKLSYSIPFLLNRINYCLI